jgi:hypothetical protein
MKILRATEWNDSLGAILAPSHAQDCDSAIRTGRRDNLRDSCRAQGTNFSIFARLSAGELKQLPLQRVN